MRLQESAVSIKTWKKPPDIATISSSSHDIEYIITVEENVFNNACKFENGKNAFMKICHFCRTLKNTLKAFNDFKNKQKKCMK